MSELLTKKWYQSKTVAGVLVIILAQILGIYGYSMDEQVQQELTEVISVLGTGLGSLIAVIGRLKAQKTIK